MSCISLVSFAILINGEASHFFHLECGLRKGFRLSPLLFLLVTEGLNIFINKAHSDGDFWGIYVSQALAITHLLFVDDILIFCDGSRCGLQKLCQGLDMFHIASSMVINNDKSTINWANLVEDDIRWLGDLFHFQCQELDAGVTYIYFYLKPNDWFWILAKIEKKLSA